MLFLAPLFVAQNSKCVYKKNIVQLRYIWHPIENFHGALLLFLVDDSDGSNHHCF